MSPVFIDDVAQAVIAVLGNDETIHRTYPLGGPEVLTWSEMVRRVAAAAGRRKWLLPVPVWLMMLAAFLFGWIPAFPVSRDQLTMLVEGNVADPAVIESLTGRPPAAFDESHLAYLRRPKAR